jgi:hypothetical protein
MDDFAPQLPKNWVVENDDLRDIPPTPAQEDLPVQVAMEAQNHLEIADDMEAIDKEN